MKTRIQSLSFLVTLAIAFGLISWGSALHAQTTPSTPSDTQATPSTPPDQQTPQTPDTPPSQQTPQPSPTPSPDAPPASQQTPSTQTPPAQTPDQAQTPDAKTDTPTATTPSATDEQTFSGTVVKSGDKYMLKTDSGKTYDIDHQKDVTMFDGKRVKVRGTLDETGTKILVK